MNRIIYRSRNYINNYRKKYLFLLFICVIGFISGVIFILFIKEKDISLIRNNINTIVDTIKNKKINYLSTFINSISKNLLSLISIYILGISIVGIPLIILFLFIKSFTLGFSISSFIKVFHIKGFFISSMYLIPSDLILLILYTLFGNIAISFSIKLFRYLFLKENINLNIYFKRLNKAFIVALFIVISISILETYLVPFIIDLWV